MAVPTKDELDRLVEGQTVASRFLETVAAAGDRVALKWQEPDESWSELNYREYADQVARVAAGLKGLGVKPGDRIVLLMRNRPEFHVADIAALFCGATPISIYNSSAPDQIEYLVNHSEATLAIVEDGGFLDRFLKVRDQMPGLRSIVVLDDEAAAGTDQATPWSDLMGEAPLDLQTAAATVSPDDLATVIYTSGTTGPPKGVKLSHYNVCFTAQGYMSLIGIDPVGFRAVSYLPMAHIAERMSSHYLGALGGYEVTPCPDTGLLSRYLTEVRPQTFFGVPRVWEKLYAGVNAALSADPAKEKPFNEAVEAARPLAIKKATGEKLTDEESATMAFLDEVAFAPVRGLLGLDQVQFGVTGAAPIPVQILEWFIAIGVPISEIYGLSETSGPMTWDPYQTRPGSVGRPFPGCEVKLLEDGEVVCRGGNVFSGYLNDEAKTAEALDADGWFHSGDIGEFDDEGYLRIVDRKKELIITAGGKNISPANLEAALKSFPLVGQAAVIGDNRPFISALLVLDSEVAPAWAKQQGIEASSLADLAKDADVLAEVGRYVAEANAKFSQVEQVKKWTLLSEEWMPDSEELTPTMKLKRRGINQKYSAEIEALYTR